MVKFFKNNSGTFRTIVTIAITLVAGFLFLVGVSRMIEKFA